MGESEDNEEEEKEEIEVYYDDGLLSSLMEMSMIKGIQPMPRYLSLYTAIAFTFFADGDEHDQGDSANAGVHGDWFTFFADGDEHDQGDSANAEVPIIIHGDCLYFLR